MDIFEFFLAEIKDEILHSMSYNFQILEKFSLGHAKNWSWGREFVKILDLDVEFHKLIAYDRLRYRDSKSAVIFNSAHKHRSHNFRR